MKRLPILLFFAAAMLFLNSTMAFNYGTCKGSKNCTACKNCKYCKHCAKEGGSCGVCKK